LSDAIVWPVRSNAGFLVEALKHEAFAEGNVDTGLIVREGDALMPPELPSDEALADAAAALIGELPMAGFRLNAQPRRTDTFLLDGATIAIEHDVAEPGSEAVDSLLIAEGGQVWQLTRWRAAGGTAGAAGDGAILAPMPGRVIAVDVAAGDTVTKGQKLLTLEAMKMEHGLTAPFDGVVAELNAAVGSQVQVDALLVRIEKAE
jgi:3-methylcrotonyl-CoA carboxylase alpha subunit